MKNGGMKNHEKKALLRSSYNVPWTLDRLCRIYPNKYGRNATCRLPQCLASPNKGIATDTHVQKTCAATHGLTTQTHDMILIPLIALIREQFPDCLILADNDNTYKGVPDWMARKPPGRAKANKPDIILGFPGPDFDIKNPQRSTNIHDLAVYFIEFTSPSENNMAESIAKKI